MYLSFWYFREFLIERCITRRKLKSVVTRKIVIVSTKLKYWRKNTWKWKMHSHTIGFYFQLLVDWTFQLLIKVSISMFFRKQLNIYREKLTILQANHERLQKLQQRENESRKCPICYENDIYYVIIPCGHTICKKCSDKWTRSDCPTCRTPIQSNMRLYLPGQY